MTRVVTVDDECVVEGDTKSARLRFRLRCAHDFVRDHEYYIVIFQNKTPPLINIVLHSYNCNIMLQYLSTRVDVFRRVFPMIIDHEGDESTAAIDII